MEIDAEICPPHGNLAPTLPMMLLGRQAILKKARAAREAQVLIHRRRLE